MRSVYQIFYQLTVMVHKYFFSLAGASLETRRGTAGSTSATAAYGCPLILARLARPGPYLHSWKSPLTSQTGAQLYRSRLR